MTRRATETAERMGGEVIAGGPESSWDGAALDSRRVRGGELFFALAGEQTDGHRFVADALARGAGGAVVARRPEGLAEGEHPGFLIRVPEVYEGLHALTRSLRAELPRDLVGITGSAGKTTTKELLAAMLAARYPTAKSAGNFNNLYGFPLSFLSIPDATRVMVAEMGMSTPGELSGVSRLGRPTVVVFLNVRPVHLENFPDLDGIAEAKAEIFHGLAEGGLAVANRDDPRVVAVTRREAAERGARIVWFGRGGQVGAAAALPEPDVTLRDLAPLGPDAAGRPRTGSRFTLVVRPGGGGAGLAGAPEGGEVEIELPLHGLYNADNCLAAAAAALALGVELEELARAVAAVRPADHRGHLHPLPQGPTLVDDSYNSNPEALTLALESAAALAAPGGRKAAILGDMLELGPEEAAFHREAGRRAAAAGFAPIVGVGPLCRELVAGAEAAGAAPCLWLEDAAAAARWAAEALASGELAAGDVLLVKGSRGIGLDRVVDELLGSDGPDPNGGSGGNP